MSGIGVARLSWDGSGRVLSAEGDTLAICGQAAGALIGRPLLEALRASSEDVAALTAFARQPEGGVRYLRRSEDGRFRYLRAAVLPGKSEPFVGYFSDMESVMDDAPPVQISRLSSSLSHEIRNPLSSVKMAVQTLARNTELGERDKRRLAIANREIRTMERMLWLLSEYGRDSLPEPIEVPVRTLVQDSAALVDPELKERSVQLEIAEDVDGIRTTVDAPRFRPVLSQLLMNVAMGLEQGGTLYVSIRKEGGRPAIVLRDDAASVPDEEAAKIFEPFGSRLARGAGLSLAALKRVVQAAGGDVAARGSESPGTVFTVTLPP